MMIDNKLLIILLIIIVGCNKTHKHIIKENNTSTDTLTNASFITDTAAAFNMHEIEEYKKEVIKNGDNTSFTRLIIYYENKADYIGLQKYATIMADKYNNGDGCSQAFINIVAIKNNNNYNDITDFSKIDEKAKIDALKYLKKGVSLNDIDCMSMLEEIYRNGIGINKNIEEANQLKQKIIKM